MPKHGECGYGGRSSAWCKCKICTKLRKKRNKKLRERYRADSEYRRKLTAAAAKWQAENPEKVAAMKREWSARPEVRKKLNRGRGKRRSAMNPHQRAASRQQGVRGCECDTCEAYRGRRRNVYVKKDPHARSRQSQHAVAGCACEPCRKLRQRRGGNA